MANIHSKTLQDLEFPSVLKQVSARCHTELGKAVALEIAPYITEEVIKIELGKTAEYLSSLISENRIPNHGFDSINGDLKLLKIENTTLELQGFKRIASICTTVAEHQKFFKKFKEYYPLFYDFALKLEPNTEIPVLINNVIDRFGEVKDNASDQLFGIRRQINVVRGKISQSFGSALNTYQSSDYLDEIRESVVENRRVLAVKAMYRKKVKGAVMGTSKTGSIVYIEPEAALKYSRELNNLEFEEKEEVQRILKQLTAQIRPFRALLRDYQEFLSQVDVIAAKAKYAEDIDALLPKINSNNRLFLRDAYHPLLFLNNKRKGEKTYPQTIELHDENRIIVISGPNAGGKSITLKTIGLLQVMLQSGMLIPVHERSEVCFFKKILTDIGDNQSIENHLSTYS